MPNFVTSSINTAPYVSASEDIKFGWSAVGRNVNLILAEACGEEFFLLTKKRDEKSYVVKGEKLTKPAKIGLLQKALTEFKERNCKGVISEAIAVKKTHLTQKDSAVKDIAELIEILKRKERDKIFIEIGFGSGRHLLFQAEQNSDVLMIGIEVYKPGVEQVAKLAKTKSLNNVVLINADARLLFSLIDSNVVDKIFLHFPVPWDDAAHRRVVSADFVRETNRVLKTGGSFELRSDSRPYVDYCLANLMDLPSLNAKVYKNKELAVSSKYEDRWKKRQKDIYDVIFICEEDSAQPAAVEALKFDDGYDTEAIRKNFKNFTRKFEDYFLHVEELFVKSDDEILLRVAFGDFCRPEHCYVFVSSKRCEYFIKRPSATKENLKAHLALKEYLANAKDY